MRHLTLAAVVLGGLTMMDRGAEGVRADEPAPAEPRINLAELQALYDQFMPRMLEGRRPEAATQLMMILFSTASDPVPGWYGPGRSRYDWTWLAARFDANRDGAVARKEFLGPDATFQRLDRDRNGRVTADDLDWSSAEWYQRELTFQTRLRTFDADGDGKLTAQEWAAYFQRLAGDKGVLDASEARKALLPPSESERERAYFAAMPLKLRRDRLQGILKGDVGSFNEGPQVGDLAPDFTLETQDGKQSVTLSSFRGRRPVVLTFGSYTCPPYRALFGGLESVRERFGDRVDFLAVYVREAHPTDGWIIDSNETDGIEIVQPTNSAERLAVAGKFCSTLKPNFSVLVDKLDDKVGHAYSGMPNRLYLIDVDGKIAYKSGRGPRGYKTGELAQSVELYLLDQNATTSPGNNASRDRGKSETVARGQ